MGSAVNGENEEPGRNALIENLADSVRALGDRNALTIAELGAGGVVAWDVRRDANGVARAWYWPPVPWSAVYNDGVLVDEELRRVTRSENGSSLLYVATSADELAVETLDWLRASNPDVVTFQCTASLSSALREVLADDPLTRWYDLVVLRQTRSGRLALARLKLFSPEAASGNLSEPFTIRCAHSDRSGTAFAVVSSRSRQRDLRLVSVQSAKIPADTYQDVVAELRGPGLVSFHGLHVQLREDHRSWQELIDAVPDRLERIPPSHLVIVVEVSGTTDEFDRRLDLAGQLIQEVVKSKASKLAVSVVAYGSHAVERGVPDEKPRVLTWASSADIALAELGQLGQRGPMRARYVRAAQLECALAETADRLTGQHGRPAVVTIGSRPPFPPRVEASEIVPCPRRTDWRSVLSRMREHVGVTFGAIHDSPDNQIWQHLGGNATAGMETFSARRFAIDLRLMSSAVEQIPFPIIETSQG
jgi:hypothetical protein